MKSTLFIALVAAMMLIVVVRASAQDGCYPYQVAYVERLTEIHAHPGLDDRAIGTAKRGECFAALNSTRAEAGECWVQVWLGPALEDVGWLLVEDVTAIPVSTQTPCAATPSSTRVVGLGCYGSRWAYLTSASKIRRAPSADSELVGQAEKGDVLEVIASHQSENETDCWLLMEAGWIAQTDDVQLNVPLVIDPPIGGDKEFKAEIDVGLNYLRENAPRWYLYFWESKPTIEPCGPCLE